MKRLSIFFGLFLIPVVIIAQTIISGGNVSGNWSSSNSPYLIYGEITLQNDETLMIEPGVTVIFHDNYKFVVEGQLFASGAQNDSIIFTVADTSGYYNGTHLGWGGIYGVLDFSVLQLDFCIFEYCKSPAIQISDKNLSLQNSTIRYSFAGIYLDECSVDISHISVHHNNGQGIFVNQDHLGDFQAEYFDIRDNNGNGIYVYSGPNSFDLSHGIICSNKSTGIYILAYDQFFAQIDDVIIESNGDPDYDGGGIYNNASLSLNHATIRNNTAAKGGGIYDMHWQWLEMHISNSIIENNEAEQDGGGIYSSSASSFSVNNSIVRNNKASNGGGLFLTGDDLLYSSNANHLYNVEVTMNQALNNGGGIYLNLWIMNTYKNSHLTFSENIAANSGIGIYNISQNNAILIGNSIVWENELNAISDLYGTLNISYSDINGSWSGIGNIDQNPLFIESANRNFHLSWINYPNNDYTKSPCIDTGDPALPCDPDGTIADMGAYFFDQAAQQAYLLDIKVFLEGPYFSNQMTPFLNTLGFLPLDQPYNILPWEHFGTESVTAIPNNTVVDWIFVEIKKVRDFFTPSLAVPVSRQSAFLLNDGRVRILDGTSLPEFYTSEDDSLFIFIHHRNHLPVISSTPITLTANPLTYDFTISENMAMGGSHSQNQLTYGLWGMIAGDANADGQVDSRDKNDVWLIENSNAGYYVGDFNLDGQVNQYDKTLRWNANAGKGFSK